MSELEEIKIKSKKNHLWPVFLIIAVLFFIFFSQYPNNLKTFFSTNATETKAENLQEQPKVALEEIPEIANPTEETPNPENSEGNVVPEEVTKEDSQKEEAEKEEAPRPDLTIGIIADAHVGQEKGFSHLNSAISVLRNQVQPDIVIDLGDLIESRNKKEGFISKKSAQADYKKAHSMITAYYPVYHVIGNHELLSLSKDNVNDLTGRKNYYSVTVKSGYRLIILDANYTKNGIDIDAKHDDAFIYTGNVSERQLSLLNNELKNNDKNIIFIHHPLWNLENKNDVSRIIKKYKDKAILVANGHKHPLSLEAISFGGINNYNIPSAYHQRMVTVVKINGNSAEVSTIKY